MKPSTIDAHHHLWHLHGSINYQWLDQLELRAIRRDYLPTDLQPLLEAEGIQRSIFVQTLADPNETLWALAQAERFPFIAGVVGWVDLQSQHCQEMVETLQTNPLFVGVRHVVHDEPDPNFLLRPAVIRGLQVLESRGIPYDLLIRPEHLPLVPILAHTLPNLRMVIDHLAKPLIKSGQMSGWIDPMRLVAQFPNVYCKLSGMVTEADHRSWQLDQLKPYVRETLEFFGPNRLMFGSDWPVCELAASYHEVHQGLKDLLADLSSVDQSAIFGGTAQAFYQPPLV